MHRRKINFKLRQSVGWLIPGISLGMLAVFGIVAICPILMPEVRADEGDGATTLTAILTPSVTLSMADIVSENVEPTMDGIFKNIATVARVQVMNSEYYDVSISGNPNMAGQTHTDESIKAISGAQTSANFAPNTWGYAASKNAAGVTTAVVANASTIYKPMPSTNTQIVNRQSTTNNAANDYYTLNFGAKVDTNIPADTYSSRVTLSVVVSPILPTEYSIVYNANGGTGTAPEIQYAGSYEETYEFTVSGQGSLDKSGYAFLGWAESDSATTAQYTEGSKITLTEDNPTKTLYAVWQKLYGYSVIYNANGGTGTAPATQTAESTAETYEFTAAAQGDLAKSGYTFLGWAENSSATTATYTAGSSKISLTKASPAKTLYAVWRKTTLSDITNMQDMTSDICSASAPNETKQLKDTRDGKYYWVGKLVDGKCWMTQNLDLDLSTSKYLSPSDSDVLSNWTPGYSTATTASNSTILADNTGQRSWSLGDYRITNPTASNDCGYPKNSAADCSSQFTAYTTPTSANDDTNAHYILGNHYQWNAATAGTGGSITGGQASSSICPKGWKLPESNITTAGSFGGLINAGSIGTDVAKLTSSPYYFVRGGRVLQDTGILFSFAGGEGTYWASTPYSLGGDAYNLYFSSTNFIDPSDHSNRNLGFPVRCIAATEYTYTITYQFGNGYVQHSTVTLPETQTVTTSNTSQTFTISGDQPFVAKSSCFGALTSWVGDDGVTYNPGASVTLTSSKPNLVLTVKSATLNRCF